MTNAAEDFDNEEHIYFSCLNLELIYQHHEFLFHIYLRYCHNNLTIYYD